MMRKINRHQGGGVGVNQGGVVYVDQMASGMATLIPVRLLGMTKALVANVLNA